MALANFRRRREQPAAEPVRAELDVRQRVIELRRIRDVRRAGRREVALVREVRSLRELDAGDELGDEEVQIRIALAVRVRRHVDRRARHGHREVAAVIEVEAAQKVLVRFALAAVLRDDHARHGLEHFALPHQRSHVELLRRDRTLARRLRDADQVLRLDSRRRQGSQTSVSQRRRRRR